MTVREIDLSTGKEKTRKYTKQEKDFFAEQRKELQKLEKYRYKQLRADEYPAIGDQLDAIWKELNARRLKGENLTQDADDMLGQILAVKRKHPKPEDA